MGGFSYHPTYHSLRLCHLNFANELFLILGADCQSFQFHLINEALQKFYLFSGLEPNFNKSAIYYAGVGAYVKEIVSRILAISEGHLPVKYLDVPVISTNLKAEDCLQLKEKTL